MESATPAPTDSDTGLLCPGCGYDLRGATSDRCSECGLQIDHDSLRRTAIAWAYRRQIGWVRAFLKTTWQLTIDAQAIRHEAARQQDLKSARRFRLVLALLLAGPAVGLCITLLHLNGGLEELAVQVPSIWAGMNYPAGWKQDLAVPWSAGATFWPVLPACIALYAYYLTGAGQGVLAWWKLPTPRQEAARTLLLYAGAPLLWLALGILVWTINVGLLLWRDIELPLPAQVIATWIWFPMTLVGLIATFGRTMQWRARLTHDGFFSAVLGGGQLLALWLFAAIVWFGLVPWCIGFFWIAADSLR